VDTAVAFARLHPAQIEAYALSGEGVGKAGGYAVQGRAAAFVRELIGSYSGVVGLPLFEVAQLLRGRGYPVP
jgi:septum formation protein